mmetsp:Transcript_11872/g.28200  ORF Transcript_11872/g.28200 Transcript_11872/m.28200 type:complete len:730 (-) Transcript_11872:608-2797(-)
MVTEFNAKEAPSRVSHAESRPSNLSNGDWETRTEHPEWFEATPGVAKVMSLDPKTEQFRSEWRMLRHMYSSRHNISNAVSFKQEATELSKRLQSSFFPVIHAQKSRYLRYWDAAIMVLIAITTVVQPYEMVFTPPGEYFALNVFMDAVFLLDVLLQFNISYYDVLLGKPVLKHGAVAKHYMKSNFLVDLLGSLPYELVLLAVDVQIAEPEGVDFLTDRNRLIFMLPVLRMLRILRAPRLVARFEQIYRIDHGLLSILTFLVQTMMLSHFTACLWGMAPVVEGSAYHFNVAEGETLISQHIEYSTSLYFAVKTLTSVGYGDVVPYTTYERWLAMLIMLCGAYFFGYVVGSITNTVSVRNHAQNFFYETMDKLQEFTEEHQISKDLRIRLRSFFVYRYQSDATSGVSWNEIFDLMSPSLKQQVAKNTCAKWISHVRYFKGCEEEFVIQLSLSLHPETYTPREKIISLGEESNRMYVVRQGVVASEGRIFISGGVIGLDMLTNLYIKGVTIRNFEAIALTFSNVMRCDRDDLLQLLDKFPSTSATLRRTILRHVFQTEVLCYSRAVVRLLTGKRSIHARFMGDPSGRESHYYKKLLELSPEQNIVQIRYTLSATSRDREKKGAGKPERTKTSKSRKAQTPLHRARDAELQKLLPFEGDDFSKDDLPMLILKEIRELKSEVDKLKTGDRSNDKLTRAPTLTRSSSTEKSRAPDQVMKRIPSLPYRLYNPEAEA